MNFLVQASTDIGISKATNQDSLCIKVINAGGKKMVFAVLCDGMGGLSKGEVASAELVKAFCSWAENDLPYIANGEIPDHVIRTSWENIVSTQSRRIMDYGTELGIKLGTTISAILLTESRYYILNVGDTRIYEISDQLKLLTRDQTLVQKEVDSGAITPEQALRDPRRSVLLQCIGASTAVYPDMFFGRTKYDAVYMLCTDGFRHEISEDEIYEAFSPDVLLDVETMKNNSQGLIELNKQRKENDNISVALIRTF